MAASAFFRIFKLTLRPAKGFKILQKIQSGRVRIREFLGGGPPTDYYYYFKQLNWRLVATNKSTHAARKTVTTLVKQLLLQTIPGRAPSLQAAPTTRGWMGPCRTSAPWGPGYSWTPSETG